VKLVNTATVLWETDSRGVATICLNRPGRHNAYNDCLVRDLGVAMDALEADRSLRAVVMRANGRHFQAGADLNWVDDVRQSDMQRNLDVSLATARIVDRLNHVSAPTIALVQGFCVGGGTGLVAACDIVLAATDAKFAVSEVRWGLTASIIIPQLLDAIGARQLRRYALTGERFDSWEARRLGLVHEVLSGGNMETRCEEILSLLLENAPDAIADTKSHILALSNSSISDAAKFKLAQAHATRRQTAEAQEGLASFKEKRNANWSK
ncbi:MAG: enoyl-CoA hydratase-related protein, partial [Hyphomicrobiaceae bacterium]